MSVLRVLRRVATSASDPLTEVRAGWWEHRQRSLDLRCHVETANCRSNRCRIILPSGSAETVDTLTEQPAPGAGFAAMR